MRELRNPWVGMTEYNCFGCCPDNPIGCQMKFYEDGDDIVSVWCPTQAHQSWVNTLHGGIQSALLDEICGWVIFRKCNTAGVTARMEIRYRRPISTRCHHLVLRARLLSLEKKLAKVQGEIRDDAGQLCMECQCTYFAYPEEKAGEMHFQRTEPVGPERTLEEVIQSATKPKYRMLNGKL